MSSLADQIRGDLVVSMKAGDALVTLVLRMLLSEMNYKKINVQRELTDADIRDVVAHEVKKRREAIESYTAGGRPEQAQTEQQELEILSKYMPKMMDEEEIKTSVIKILESISIEDRKEFGKVMKVAAPQFKGRADGAMVAKVVKECLQ